LEEFNKARRSWAGSAEGQRYDGTLDTVIRSTRFRLGERIAVESTHQVRVEDLARRLLTYSISSPAVLGDKVETMLREVEARFRPMSNAGIVDEVVLSTAQVVQG